MPIPDSKFCCPRCRSRVIRNREDLVCEVCGERYHIKGGIIDFRVGRKDYYFNPITRQQMHDIIVSTSASSWRKTIHQFMSYVDHDPEWLDNLVVDGLYSWKFFLSLPKDATVLDLGCGLGNLSKNILVHVDSVIAIDLIFECLEFSRKRFELFSPQSEIALVAGGDGSHLPIADGSIDCVILSGVLGLVACVDELWLGGYTRLNRLKKMILSYFGKDNPRKIQLSFLSDIARVLKPEGELFIATENRLNYEYFFGRADHHSNLMYGSLLPRFISSLYSIAACRRPYRNYTYTKYGYEKLLREAGFDNNYYYGLSRGYTHLERANPIKTNSKYLIRATPKNKKQKLKQSAYFVPSYGIVAKKSNKVADCFLDRVIEEALDQIKPIHGNNISIDEFIVTGKDKIVLFAKLLDKRLIIKIAMNKDAEFAEVNNGKSLDAFSGLAIKAYLPEAITSGCFQGASYFIEECVEGIPARECIDKGNDRLVMDSIEVYFRNVAECNNFKITLNANEEMKPSILSTLNRLLEFVNDEESLSILEVYYLEQMAGKEIGVGAYHGDFSVSNLLMTDDGAMKIIDWESSKLHGFPIIDAINFVESSLRSQNPGYTLLDTINMLSENLIPSEYQKFIGNCYDILGTDRELHSMFVNLYWLNHVSSLIDTVFQYDVKMIDTVVLKVMRNIISECRKKQGPAIVESPAVTFKGVTC